MKFSLIAASLFATVAMAGPMIETRHESSDSDSSDDSGSSDYEPCPGTIYSAAVCCSVNALDLAAVECAAREFEPQLFAFPSFFRSFFPS